MRPRSYTKDTAYAFSTCEDGITVPEESRSIVEEWHYVLAQWDKFVVSDREKARSMVRRGIPHEIRGEAWKIMCGAEALKVKNPGVFEALAQQSTDAEVALVKDIHRTFPSHKDFKQKEGAGQKALYRVLKAFAIMDPEVGYCQGMSFICGVLVTYLSDIDAFWVIVSMLKSSYNMRGLFLNNLPLLKQYLYRFHYLVVSYLPELAHHFDENGVKPLFYAAEWFSTLYTYNFSLKVASRIWDMFFFEGPEYLFRIGLAILKSLEKYLLQYHFDGIVTILKQIPGNVILEKKISGFSDSKSLGKRKKNDYAPKIDAETLFAMAEKFTELKQIIVAIDKKYEVVKDNLLSDGDPNVSKRPRNDSIKKHVNGNGFNNSSNNNNNNNTNNISNNNNIGNEPKYKDDNEDDTSNENNDEYDTNIAKGRKLGGKRHLVFQYDEGDSNSPNKIIQSETIDNDNNVDDDNKNEGRNSISEDNDRHRNSDDFGNDNNTDDFFKILNLINESNTPSPMISSSPTESDMVLPSTTSSLPIPSTESDMVLPPTTSSLPIPSPTKVYPTITSFSVVESPGVLSNEEILSSIVNNLSLKDSNNGNSSDDNNNNNNES